MNDRGLEFGFLLGGQGDPQGGGDGARVQFPRNPDGFDADPGILVQKQLFEIIEADSLGHGEIRFARVLGMTVDQEAVGLACVVPDLDRGFPLDESGQQIDRPSVTQFQ